MYAKLIALSILVAGGVVTANNTLDIIAPVSSELVATDNVRAVISLASVNMDLWGYTPEEALLQASKETTNFYGILDKNTVLDC